MTMVTNLENYPKKRTKTNHSGPGNRQTTVFSLCVGAWWSRDLVKSCQKRRDFA